jgi:hypothetical protein
VNLSLDSVHRTGPPSKTVHGLPHLVPYNTARCGYLLWHALGGWTGAITQIHRRFIAAC